MMEIRLLTDTRTTEYEFMTRLLAEAFPPEEYREPEQLREYTEGCNAFSNNLIYADGIPVGLLTYWDFGRFHYVEHFAMLPAVRGRGLGGEVLAVLRERLRTPIVLEVELPVDELTRRRVAFYMRHGFCLWEREYLQPPYRKGGPTIPMRLMVHGALGEACFETVRRTLYKEVYGRV